MNEKLFEMLDERLSRIEDKVDTVINQHGDHKERLVKLESQAGFFKWIFGAAVTILGSLATWLIERTYK